MLPSRSEPARDVRDPHLDNVGRDPTAPNAPNVRDAELLDAGLTAARRADGWCFVALPAPVVSSATIADGVRSGPLVAWTSRELTVVGIGIAHELRGVGAARWQAVTAGARAITVSTQLGIASTPAASAGISARLARPRLLGGLAFVPGAADRPPWTGFGDAWFVLPRWTYVHDGARACLVLALDAKSAAHAERWRDELTALRATLATGFTARPQPPLRALEPGDAATWHAQVTAITDVIADGACEKIVPARTAVVTLAGPPRAADLLSELDARHADCYRVLVRPPDGGALVAATPERLVRLDGDHVACDALAGSIARGEHDDARAPLASGKDRREHALVVGAIVTALRELGGDVVAPAEPAVRTLRHVLHLHTPITATLARPCHVLELAERLHPTPAVGGTPKQFATDWIASHEASPRGWYAAPVGWFDLDGNGELAVAIRSGLLAGDQAHLWAGAGIVAGSDLARELAETELKLRAMLGALGVGG